MLGSRQTGRSSSAKSTSLGAETVPRYRLELREGSTAPPSTQSVDLEHDADALDLAQIALLSTAEHRLAEIYRDDLLIGMITRDSSSCQNNYNNQSYPS